MRSLIASFIGGAAGGALVTLWFSRRKPDWSALRPVITALATKYEIHHLRRLADSAAFPFQRDETTWFFEAELRRLHALGFIDSPQGRSIETLLSAGGDVKNHVRATERGRAYLALYDEVEHERRISC